jgi:MFS family permease
MTDPSPTEHANPPDPRRKWVLFGSVAMLFISGGGMYLIVVALKDVAMEFGWPRAVPSFAFSLQFIGSGFGGVFMGQALDRYGFGVPAVIGSVMIGIGAMLVNGIDSAWQLYLIYGIMFGLAGQGSLAAPAMANIARWYDTGRGRAVGIVSSGQALAGIVWPPIFGMVMLSVGWRDMFFWFGLFALCLMLPLCLIVRQKPPGFAARNPSGSAPQDHTPARTQPLTNAAIQIQLCCAIFGCCVAMALPLGHLVAFVTDRGHPIQNAVEVLSAMLMAAFISRAVLLGVISDRVGGLRALFIFSIVQGTTLATFTVIHDLIPLYIVAVAFGLGYGGLFPIYSVVIRDHLPIGEIGKRTGIIFLFGAVAMGFGSWMGGYLFDITGGYTLPFLIGASFNLVNLVIVTQLTYRLRNFLPGRVVLNG